MAIEEKNIVGSGLVFPLNIDSDGGVRPETGESLIESSLNNIFATPNNSAYFLGEFNSRINELLEEPNDEVTLNILDRFIQDSIDRWEPRIKLSNITRYQTDTQITVELTYFIRGSQVENTYVFPFYNQIIY